MPCWWEPLHLLSLFAHVYFHPHRASSNEAQFMPFNWEQSTVLQLPVDLKNSDAVHYTSWLHYYFSLNTISMEQRGSDVFPQLMVPGSKISVNYWAAPGAPVPGGSEDLCGTLVSIAVSQRSGLLSIPKDCCPPHFNAGGSQCWPFKMGPGSVLLRLAPRFEEPVWGSLSLKVGWALIVVNTIVFSTGCHTDLAPSEHS